MTDLELELYTALEAVLRYCVTPKGLPDRNKGRTEEQQKALDAARVVLTKVPS